MGEGVPFHVPEVGAWREHPLERQFQIMKHIRIGVFIQS